MWVGYRSTDKSYSGDNRLVWSKSPYRRPGSAPRCRLVASWGGRSSQGFGCSPIKAARELGSNRQNGGFPERSGLKKSTHIGETLILTLHFNLSYVRIIPREVDYVY